MSEKNVHQLQWKQKNQDQSMYASRSAGIQSTTAISNQSATSAAGAATTISNHPSHSGALLGTPSNGRYPIIVSGGNPQSSGPPPGTSGTPSTPTSSSAAIGLQHFHHMHQLQQQQQHQLSQQQQQQQQHQHQHQHQHQSHHPPPPSSTHQTNAHFELSKIMANSGALTRMELPPSLGNHPVSSAITENVLSLIGMSPSSAGSSNRPGDSIKIPDEEKLRKVQTFVESNIGDHARQQILQIIDRISTLKPVERLLLYLRMPGETPESDPLRQPQNPLGARSEINHTINWVRSHLEHDPKVSIPKQDVYNDYILYCERLDIKPLSTADFGKVMKQVFPEIRPRRLGTRGHSRYCYAAMRKTTKLTPPQLPMLGGKNIDAANSEIECVSDAESWNTVRTWAEGLLNAKFDSIKDLAEHIGKSDYVGSGAGSSRVLLQKKLLQRDAKEKRVYADSGPLKKRRKKKRKGSTSSESSTTQQTSSVGSLNDPSRSCDDILIAPHTIKQEVLDSPNSQPQIPVVGQMHLQHATASYDGQMHSHQLLPMNLATENERTKSLGQLPTNSPVAKNLTKAISDLAPLVNLLPIEQQTAQLASVKEEIINDEYNPQNVICKKVRRAHLTKGILATSNSTPSTITTSRGTAIEAPTAPPSIALSPAAVSHYSMGPPAQTTTTAMETAKVASQLRAKKLRYLQAHSEMYQTYDQQQQQQNQHQSPLVDNVEITEDKDVVPENLGLPRERVISICNMDKHELDDYLNANDEENSQDQDAELLQYFQTGDAENNNNNNKETQLQQQQQQHQQQPNIDAPNPTLTEMNSNSAFEIPNKKKSIGTTGSGCITKDRDDITQLRNYLHQNLETIGALAAGATVHQKGNIQVEKCPSNGNHYIMPGIYNEGSASASLAIMSQKHLKQAASPSVAMGTAAVGAASATHTVAQPSNIGITTSTIDPSVITPDEYTAVPNNVRATQKRKINLNAMVPASNTTQRRKNCTFFPISPNINLTNTTINSTLTPSSTTSMSAAPNINLFASPRPTTFSVRNKPVLHKQQSLPAADKNVITSANDPMIGATRNNRNYNSITSASAPPSPSILQDTIMLNKSYVTVPGNPMGGYNSLLLNHDYQHEFANSCGTNKMLPNDQNSLECVLDEPPSHLMAESRSRSVPLQYCNSPAFNQTTNYPGFLSTCSSAAQTPVPPHFADFNDTSSILDIFSDTSQTHGTSIKLEESTGSLLCGSVADILPPENVIPEYGRIPNNFGGIVSRSVPSTPLPLQNAIDPFFGSKNHEQKQDITSSAQNKYSTKMYDISKSMPTTPITSNTATPSFRYSPEFNRDFLINGNTVESTPAYSRAPSVAAGTAPSLTDSLLDDGREGESNSLTDGMDDLGSFGEVSEADILNMNNL